MIKFLTFTDSHIHDEVSLTQALSLIANAVKRYKPDILIGLGDTFNSGADCLEWGQAFSNKIRNIIPKFIAIYGNHDGGDIHGVETTGWETFKEVFGNPQRVETLDGQNFILLADMQNDSGWEDFALEHTGAGSVVLSHSPLKQELLDKLSGQGARLVLNGHKHVFHVQQSRDGKLTQFNLPPLGFAGFNFEQAGVGFGQIEKFQFTLQFYPHPLAQAPYNPALWTGKNPLPPQQKPKSHLPGEPDAWLSAPRLRDGTREWLGSLNRLQHYKDGKLEWDKSFGTGHSEAGAMQRIEQNGVEYLILCGTWIKKQGSKKYESLAVINPETGELFYQVEVIGVSGRPVVKEGILYIAGQWREIIAIELATGKELWRNRCQSETEATKECSWHDGKIGGGWTVTPPKVGKHIWVINSRGDLFGYDKETGKEKFVYQAAIPLNADSRSPYSPTLSCNPFRWEEEEHDGQAFFVINGAAINDQTGALLGVKT